VRCPSPCSPSAAGLKLGSVRCSLPSLLPPFPPAPALPSLPPPSATPSLYCLSTASAAASLLASSGWDGARARGPAAPSARPGAFRPNGMPPDLASRSRTQPSRPVWHPPVQPKNGKSDLEVALPALSWPLVWTV
jgi:hypothetical protein